MKKYILIPRDATSLTTYNTQNTLSQIWWRQELIRAKKIRKILDPFLVECNSIGKMGFLVLPMMMERKGQCILQMVVVVRRTKIVIIILRHTSITLFSNNFCCSVEPIMNGIPSRMENGNIWKRGRGMDVAKHSSTKGRLLSLWMGQKCHQLLEG